MVQWQVHCTWWWPFRPLTKCITLSWFMADVELYCYFLVFCCWYQYVVFIIHLIFLLSLMPQACVTSRDSKTLSQMWHRKKTWISYCLDILGANNMRCRGVHIVTKLFNLVCFSKYFFLNHMLYSHMIYMLMLNPVLVLLL